MDKAKETFVKVFGTVKEKWTGVAPRTRAVILAVAGVVVVSAVVITLILNSAHYTLLYSAADAAEAREVENLLAMKGYGNVRIVSGNKVMVPDNAPLSDLKLELSMEGYPRDGASNFNNDVYNTGINMFSTESDRQQFEIFQLQENLMSTFNAIPQVSSSRVILNVQKQQNYVLNENKLKSGASVMLRLKTGETLTTKQIDGVYNFTRSSVPGLEMENITVTDGNGIRLIPSDIAGTASENLALEQQRFAMYTEFRTLWTELAYTNLDALFKDVFGKYRLAVDVEMDYQNIEGESTTYTPVVNNGGIMSEYVRKYAAGGTAAEGGAIGTAVNSDISPPDYPTVPDIAAGNDFYIEQLDEITYKINEERKKYADDGLRVKKVTASVIVDSERLSDAEVAEWKGIIAGAIQADVENVQFKTASFVVPPKVPGEGALGGSDAARNLLIYIIICLGALLIILFTLAIMTSGSKKKRMVRYRGAAPVVDGEGSYYRADMFQTATEDTEGFDLPSLMDNEVETKDVVLKREIKEFSKSNPEIVAQLIRTWLRTDE